MIKTPVVSVIVATYNSRRTLQWTLQSILNQSFVDFEVHVIGDGCTDDSEHVVQLAGDARVHWLNLPQNSGTQAMPNNAGIDRAQGEFIAYLGHDDLWFPHHLAVLIDKIREPGTDFVHSMTAFFDQSGLAGTVGTPRSDRGHMWHSAPPSSWLHRRELAARLSGWRAPTQLPSGVDMDFFHRAHAAGAGVQMAPRLSVLKFPSPNFRLYDQASPHPQAEYWRQMVSNPIELEHAVLSQAARLLAKWLYGDPPMRELFSYVSNRVIRKMRRIVLAHEPLARLEGIRFDRFRRKIHARRRGLPPS